MIKETFMIIIFARVVVFYYLYREFYVSDSRCLTFTADYTCLMLMIVKNILVGYFWGGGGVDYSHYEFEKQLSPSLFTTT